MKPDVKAARGRLADLEQVVGQYAAEMAGQLRALLDYTERLEAVAEAARLVVSNLPAGRQWFSEEVELRAALAALDEPGGKEG